MASEARLASIKCGHMVYRSGPFGGLDLLLRIWMDQLWQVPAM